MRDTTNGMSPAYRAGREACSDGLGLSECPHRVGSEQRADWERGWASRYNAIMGASRPRSEGRAVR